MSRFNTDREWAEVDQAIRDAAPARLEVLRRAVLELMSPEFRSQNEHADPLDPANKLLRVEIYRALQNSEEA